MLIVIWYTLFYETSLGNGIEQAFKTFPKEDS